MLVLSRKQQQTLVIDGRIRVTILGIRSNVIRIGIEAPKEIPIVREELELHRSAVPPCGAVLGSESCMSDQVAESGALI